MDIYLIDGTYELFRFFYAVPSDKDRRVSTTFRQVLTEFIELFMCVGPAC